MLNKIISKIKHALDESKFLLDYNIKMNQKYLESDSIIIEIEQKLIEKKSIVLLYLEDFDVYSILFFKGKLVSENLITFTEFRNKKEDLELIGTILIEVFNDIDKKENKLFI